MIEELYLKNFRCFDNYKVEFDKFNIIVGKNDTGKSTIIDALKLVSNVRRYAPYRDYYLEERDIPFSRIYLNHNYTPEDSVVQSKFSDGTEIEIIFPVEDRPYAWFLVDGVEVSKKEIKNKYLYLFSSPFL